VTSDAPTAQALRLASAVGPYFAVALRLDEREWLPFTRLLEPEVLRDNVATVQRVLGERTGLSSADLDLRACASTHFLGLASRLVAPALGAACLGGQVPRLAPGDVHWLRVEGGPVPLAVSSIGGAAVISPGEAAGALHEGIVGPLLEPLATAFAETFSLSRQVLWGNVASALAGAATMLARSGAELLLDPVATAMACTVRGALAEMGDWTEHGFVRRNCCLFYKIPGGGLCGDCVLA
jgi:hypothetical protein